jgi:hypothetical protein
LIFFRWIALTLFFALLLAGRPWVFPEGGRWVDFRPRTPRFGAEAWVNFEKFKPN